MTIKMPLKTMRPRGRRLIMGAVGLLAAGLASGVMAAAGSAGTTPAHVLDRIPAHILPSGTPVPVSPELVRVSNAWLVSDGVTLVAVYAGSAGTDPSMGRFVIVRQNTQTGQQTLTIVNVPGSHGLSLVGTPTGASVETAAQQGDLRFRDAAGRPGILNLSNNTTNRN
jgi:hypothetical protein